MIWPQFAQQYQGHINQLLQQHLAGLPPLTARLAAAMSHGALLGGKRMRPLLVYAVGQLNGTANSKLDGAAMAIEFIHAYSLIHDDLPAMDDDALRRGQPTCHIAFDEATAILAGDALHSEAFSLLVADSALSVDQRLALVYELALAAGYRGMCGGQALDLAATGQQISLQQLTALHRHKTGALIRAAVRMGAICAGLTAAETAALDRYADAVGLAFQVHDDVLDEVGDTQTLGKPQGSDRALAKSTYVAHLGVEGARSQAEQLVAEALHALAPIPYNSALLAAIARYAITRNH